MTENQQNSGIPAEELAALEAMSNLSGEEYAELAAYVEEGNKLMLRKSYAMKHLMDRGYTVTFDDLKSINT